MKLRKTTLLCLLMAALVSCKSTLDKKVNLETAKDDIAQIKKDFPDTYTPADYDEAGNIVAGNVMGNVFAKAFTEGSKFDSSKALKTDINLTYRQLLDSAKNTRIAFDNKMKAYNQAVEELNKIADIKVSSLEKKSDEYGINNYLDITYAIHLGGTKLVSGIHGFMIIYDIFGKELTRLEIKTISDLKPNMDYNQNLQYALDFDSGTKEAANTDISKLKFVWAPAEVVFDDGTNIQAPEYPKK